MVALLLRVMLLVLAGAACLWAVLLWPVSPVLAGAAVALVLGSHALALALEMVALGRVSRGDPVPVASWRERVRAWGQEVLVASRVFGWRQPFFADEVPDACGPGGAGTGRRGVVLLSGFACNRGFWTPWLRRLRAQRRVFVAPSLEPPFGSIDDYVPQVDAAVARVTAATGLPPVLVCHSMGGLAARAWLRAARADERVHHVITIGAPHQGTWLARFSQLTNGRQMRLRSDWLAGLARSEPAARAARFTCWYSDCDNVVFPPSAAVLPGARQRLVPGVAHVALAFCPQVMEVTLAAIERDCYTDDGPLALSGGPAGGG